MTTFLSGQRLTAAQLAALGDAQSAWETWSPTLTNLTLGSGTVTARYRQVGKTVDYRFKFRLGAGSAVGTSPSFTLPSTPHAEYVVDEDQLGVAQYLNAATAIYIGTARLVNTNTLGFTYVDTSGAVGQLTPVSATAPFTFGTSDTLAAYGSYEAA